MSTNTTTAKAPTYTFVVRHEDGTWTTRASATMAYTHAVEVGVGTEKPGVWSWHKSLDGAQSGLRDAQKGDYKDARIVEVERYNGGKAKIERALRTGAAQPKEKDAMTILSEKKAQAEKNDAEREAAKKTAKAPAKKADSKPAASAGSRAVPTEAANKKRQAYVAEVGMTKYRNQYNSGWDAATAGQGVKKAASGTASVAWMDGWTDRTANPGKDGIAAKWSALRSEEAPVAKVEAPAEQAPEKAEKAPSAKAKAPAKAKATKAAKKA